MHTYPVKIYIQEFNIYTYIHIHVYTLCNEAGHVRSTWGLLSPIQNLKHGDHSGIGWFDTNPHGTLCWIECTKKGRKFLKNFERIKKNG